MLGVTLGYASPEIVEILGLCGFDYVWIDAEHGPFTDREVQALVIAADGVGMASLVRIPQNQPWMIQRVMDTGASGVIVPGVNTAGDARTAVRALKYPPDGERGLSTTRASAYGLKGGLAEYVKAANANSVVVCQIETRTAVENAEEICAVPGVDAVFIGTTDLSSSYCVAGQRNSVEVNEAQRHVVEVAKKAGRAYGAIVRPDEDPALYVSQGYQVLAGGVPAFISKGARDLVKAFREACEK